AVQAANIGMLAVLAALALTETLEGWHIFIIAFLQAAVGSFENPAKQSMFPMLVPREAMANAVALNSAIHPAPRIGAPVVGGLILAFMLGASGSARIAAGVVLLIGMVGISFYTLMLIKVKLPPVPRSRGGSMVQDMVDGARFIWRNRVFTFLIGLA